MVAAKAVSVFKGRWRVTGCGLLVPQPATYNPHPVLVRRLPFEHLEERPGASDATEKSLERNAEPGGA